MFQGEMIVKKCVLLAVAALTISVDYAEAQGRRKDAALSDSAEAQARRMEYTNRMAIGKPASNGYINVAGLKVDAVGKPQMIDAKVLQVIDQEQMLVELQDARGGPKTVVWLKGVKTAGIKDGKFWRSWDHLSPGCKLKVTGTTTYKTLVGTKTVFLIEPAK
jgi:hypothetical protein